jgi:hypothetical protein
MRDTLQRIAAGDRYLSALVGVTPDRARRMLATMEA